MLPPDESAPPAPPGPTPAAVASQSSFADGTRTRAPTGPTLPARPMASSPRADDASRTPVLGRQGPNRRWRETAVPPGTEVPARAAFERAAADHAVGPVSRTVAQRVALPLDHPDRTDPELDDLGRRRVDAPVLAVAGEETVVEP